MGKRLYVGNLPFNINDQSLGDIFGQIGQVASAKVIMDRETGRSKGFGFVEMVNDADAVKAIEQYNGGDLEGRQIKVNEAKPMENRPAAQGRGFFGGGGENAGGGRGANRW